MKTVRFSSRVLGVLGVAVLAVACSVPGDDEADVVSSSRDDITTAMASMPDANIVAADDDGVPTFITGNLGSAPPTLARSMNGAEIAPILGTVAPVFRTKPGALAFKRSHQDDLGDVHYRFGQTRQGRSVIGAELLVHLRKGTVYAANGNVRDDLPEPPAATLTASAARERARAASKGVTGAITRVEGELSYFQDGTKLRLVHPIEVKGTGADGVPVRDTVLVDAADGSIVLRQPHVFTAKNREMHDARNGYSTPGALVRTETQAPVSDRIVNDNFDRLGATYDCYKTLFGRDSYDDHGAKLISTVHYSRNYVNAYWDGTQMVYGDGDGQEADNLAESMGVTAHELTHAVTERSSNLNYSGQSGGLNEGISDIFGATCDWYFMGRGPVNPIIWVIGHDVWTPNGPADDGLRYMNDPHKDGDSIDYAPDYSGQDVHYTSGVPNLAFYLMAMGGKHPRNKTTIQVTGIGIEKAAKVFYRANTSLMTASTSYAGAKTACEQAAQQLGFSADEIASVTAAWQAVGVGTPSGGTGGSSSSSSSTSGSTSSCSHSTCSTGTKLPSSCDPCVAQICASDSYCCNNKWDSTCVREVGSICQKTCR